MAQDNFNISVGKKGMNRDVHPMNLSEAEYSIAINANYEDESGNGYPMLQNEHSNILCSRFKDGYKVIGFKHDLNEDKTYYFLTNPTTKVSEIGYISSIQNITSIEEVESNCNCDIIRVLDTPLEDQTQEETCEYVTIIMDDCNTCLNFSIDYPIKEGNIHLKDEKCGKTLYWTDTLNPPRHIVLSDLERYKTIGDATCGEEEVPTCLDCEKLRIFPSFEKPCLTPAVIQYGGNLKMGTYEFLIAYCDKTGNEISQYYSLTNPVSIFDPNNNILDQTQLADRTNFGIKLEVTDLDTKFGYYKIAVIQRADVNGATSYFVEGVHPTTDDNIFYFSEDNAQRITLNKLLAIKPVYTNADGMTTSNGYLFQYGLKAQKEINLQPVVNLMGSFLRWQTSLADENLYKNGISNSLYRGYMRDEVYPFSIRFSTEDGFETALFPFINRPPNNEDLEEIDNTDVDSINSFAPNCSETGRVFRWQYYNTGSSLGFCPTDGIDTETVIKAVQKICTVEGVATIPPSTLNLSVEEPYTNLEDYINENREAICEVGSDYYDAFLCGFLSDTYDGQDCIPLFDDNCDTPVLVAEDVVVDEVVGEVAEGVEKPLNDYVRAVPPSICDIYEPNLSNGGILRDEDFQMEFMVSRELFGNRLYQTVYDRKDTGFNTDCDYARELYYITNPVTAVGQSIHLDYFGADTLAELQLPQNSTCVSGGFTNKLHQGALWYRGSVGDRDKVIIDMTKRTDCNATDDIPIGTELRLSIFDDCDDVDPVYCEIVDVNVGTLIELDAALINDDNFYVVIDAPVTEEVPDGGNDESFEINNQASKWRTAPTCGCFSLYLRNVEFTSIEVTYDEIILNKRQVYESNCEFALPIYDGCNPIAYEYGKFGYWESTEDYPDNEELFNSRALNIEEADIPVAIRDEFEEYFVEDNNSGVYTLNEETDFRCRPIRHYKFPDSSIAPFMTTDLISPFQRSLIFPVGVTIDVAVVNAFLDLAVKQGLLTQELRDKINKYEIFRGDRTLNRSIVAKGLLYDTYKYEEQNEDIYYPNYPYNDLGTDRLNYKNSSRDELTPHPFGGDENNRFTFHSPDVHFNNPTLPSEVNIEGYQFGNSRGNFDTVDGHSEWVILGSDAYSTATFLAIAEVALEAAIKVGELLVTASQGYWFVGGFTNGTGAAGAATGTGIAIGLGVAIALDGFMRVGRYRYEWLKIFRDNGQPRNFAAYYTSEGFYNYFQPNIDEGNKLRGLATSKYLKSGRYSITEENTGKKVSFNNIDRESSVYLSFGDDFPFEYDDNYKFHDNASVDPNTNSRFTSGESFSCSKGRSREIERQIASPYVSMKNYIPNQYGNVEGVKWISTGFCGKLDSTDECNQIFGGDIFISRFSLKRKIPFFLVDAMNQAPLTPFSYLQYANIGSPRYFCDYDTEQSTSVLGQLFPELGSDFTFDCVTGANSFYVRPPSKFYLYYYGIPQFLVESEINVNFRYARKEIHENFYPNFGDYNAWTQEDTVSIKRDNEYYYNDTYSKNTTITGATSLPSTYEEELYDCLYDAPNGVIYSLQDSSEQDLNDPWLVYKPLDFYQFPTSAGKLIDLKGIESAQILGRFENQVILFNAIDTLRDRLTPESQELGSAGIFANRPLEFKRTDLGYAGTQHTTMVSNEFGHFWADAMRGQVFSVDQNGKNLKEITTGLRNWFKEHLPFKVLKNNVEGLTASDLDNNFKGLGLTMGWDSRYKRVFLTKRDYVVQRPMFYSCNNLYSIEERDEIIADYEEQGYTYDGIVNCELQFSRTFEQPLPDQTDVYAIFDTSSMQVADGEAASTALNAWYAQFQIDNPDYTGNLYIIPSGLEAYLQLPALIQSGTINPTGGAWLGVQVLPPNLNTGSWIPPNDLLLLVFNDEANSQYHGAAIAGGFSSSGVVQPTATFFTDYQSMVATLPSYDSFRAVLYPVVQNIASTGGALVLQALAAMKGVQLTPAEITATGTTVDVSILQSENPYENAPIPATAPQEFLQPLEDFGWIGVYDKVSPASSVFSSEQFQIEINDLINSEAITVTEVESIPLTEIPFTDTSFFKDVSFTVAYNPLTESWVSYYSFKPNYYVSYHNYFQTGINFSSDATEIGIWSHLLTNKSYQVFYGKKYKWMIELPIKETYANKVLKTVEYWLDTRRYHNEYDFAENRRIGFNKAYIYNNSVNSGLMNLVTEEENNMFQKLDYPKTNTNSQDILATQNDKKWTFNYFFNRVRNELNNNPVWLNDVNTIDKTINPSAMTYNQVWQDRLRGDWFLLRLEQDKDSRFKQIFKWSNAKESVYN